MKTLIAVLVTAILFFATLPFILLGFAVGLVTGAFICGFRSWDLVCDWVIANLA